MTCSCHTSIGRSFGIATALAVVLASGSFWARHDDRHGESRDAVPMASHSPPPHAESETRADDLAVESGPSRATQSPSAAGLVSTASFDVACMLSTQPALAAQLPQNEMLLLPSRPERIERWRAARYFCPADFNRDDVLDGSDTIDFLSAFSTREGPFAEFLDMNGDGRVDSLDMDAFLHVDKQECDPERQMQTRAISC